MSKSSNRFIPFQEVHNIAFGKSRNSIRELLSGSYKEFKRNKFADNATDYYESLNLFVEYDAENMCAAVELTQGAVISILGKKLFKMSYSSVLDFFKQISINFNEDSYGVTFFDLGFGIFKTEGLDEVQTVIAFSDSYWEE